MLVFTFCIRIHLSLLLPIINTGTGLVENHPAIPRWPEYNLVLLRQRALFRSNRTIKVVRWVHQSLLLLVLAAPQIHQVDHAEPDFLGLGPAPLAMPEAISWRRACETIASCVLL